MLPYTVPAVDYTYKRENVRNNNLPCIVWQSCSWVYFFTQAFVCNSQKLTKINQTTCNVFFLSLFPWNLECSLPKMCFLSARVSSLFFNAFLGLAPHIRKCRNPGQRRTSHRSRIDAIKSLIISLSVAVDWKKRVHWVQWRNVQLRSVAKIEAGINSIKNFGLLSKIYSAYSYCTALRKICSF